MQRYLDNKPICLKRKAFDGTFRKGSEHLLKQTVNPVQNVGTVPSTEI